MKTELTPEMIKELKAAINRAFVDGCTKWPKIKLSELFYCLPLKYREVNSILESWEQQGSIRLIRSDNTYIEVLDLVE